MQAEFYFWIDENKISIVLELSKTRSFNHQIEAEMSFKAFLKMIAEVFRYFFDDNNWNNAKITEIKLN
jgi:hypothetical protein